MVYGTMGPYARFDYNSPYLIVNALVSYPPPLQRERNEVEKIKHILYPSADFQNNQ